MDVFVIPVGGKYVLYCEPAKRAAADVDAEAPGTFIGRWRQRFAQVVSMAEERQHHHVDPSAPRNIIERGKDWVLGWVWHRVAEQRLLWNLRTETSAVVVHPPDMSCEQAIALVRRSLEQDLARHRHWLWIDGVLTVLTGVLLGPLFILIPGVANIPFLYFGFRAAGHWFSMRGAEQGLRAVTWSGRPSEPLGELRDLNTLDPGKRAERVHDVAARLRLQHLSTFVERISMRHATPS